MNEKAWYLFLKLLKKMVVMKGCVTAVNHADVSEIVFELDHQPVVLFHEKNVTLAIGEELSVVGQRQKDGTFHAFSYKNFSKDVFGNMDLWYLPFVFPLIGALFIPFIWSGLYYNPGGIWYMAIPIFLLIEWIFIVCPVYNGIQIWRGIKLLA